MIICSESPALIQEHRNSSAGSRPGGCEGFVAQVHRATPGADSNFKFYFAPGFFKMELPHAYIAFESLRGERGASAEVAQQDAPRKVL